MPTFKRAAVQCILDHLATESLALSYDGETWSVADANFWDDIRIDDVSTSNDISAQQFWELRLLLPTLSASAQVLDHLLNCAREIQDGLTYLTCWNDDRFFFQHDALDWLCVMLNDILEAPVALYDNPLIAEADDCSSHTILPLLATLTANDIETLTYQLTLLKLPLDAIISQIEAVTIPVYHKFKGGAFRGLPNEVLVMIIRHAGGADYWAYVSLSHVSSQFRHAALGMQDIWTVLDPLMCKNQLRTHIERCKSLPFFIRLEEQGFPPHGVFKDDLENESLTFPTPDGRQVALFPYPDETQWRMSRASSKDRLASIERMNTFLDVVLPLSDRWDALLINGHAMDIEVFATVVRGLQIFSTRRLPALKKLLVTHPFDNYLQNEFEINETQRYNLYDIKDGIDVDFLNNFFINWDAPNLHDVVVDGFFFFSSPPAGTTRATTLNITSLMCRLGESNNEYQYLQGDERPEISIGDSRSLENLAECLEVLAPSLRSLHLRINANILLSDDWVLEPEQLEHDEVAPFHPTFSVNLPYVETLELDIAPYNSPRDRELIRTAVQCILTGMPSLRELAISHAVSHIGTEERVWATAAEGSGWEKSRLSRFLELFPPGTADVPALATLKRLTICLTAHFIAPLLCWDYAIEPLHPVQLPSLARMGALEEVCAVLTSSDPSGNFGEPFRVTKRRIDARVPDEVFDEFDMTTGVMRQFEEPPVAGSGRKPQGVLIAPRCNCDKKRGQIDRDSIFFY